MDAVTFLGSALSSRMSPSCAGLRSWRSELHDHGLVLKQRLRVLRSVAGRCVVMAQVRAIAAVAPPVPGDRGHATDKNEKRERDRERVHVESVLGKLSFTRGEQGRRNINGSLVDAHRYRHLLP